MSYDLSRFTTAHERDYFTALSEIQNGRKVSHWMWYIFPQLKGLGKSSTSEYYGIQDMGEAVAFLADPYLGSHLRNITQALLNLDQNNATAIFGRPDDMKLKSCMTLFACAGKDETVFQDVLNRFFNGARDRRTEQMLNLK